MSFGLVLVLEFVVTVLAFVLFLVLMSPILKVNNHAAIQYWGVEAYCSASCVSNFCGLFGQQWHSNGGPPFELVCFRAFSLVVRVGVES